MGSSVPGRPDFGGQRPEGRPAVYMRVRRVHRDVQTDGRPQLARTHFGLLVDARGWPSLPWEVTGHHLLMPWTHTKSPATGEGEGGGKGGLEKGRGGVTWSSGHLYGTG